MNNRQGKKKFKKGFLEINPQYTKLIIQKVPRKMRKNCFYLTVTAVGPGVKDIIWVFNF